MTDAYEAALKVVDEMVDDPASLARYPRQVGIVAISAYLAASPDLYRLGDGEDSIIGETGPFWFEGWLVRVGEEPELYLASCMDCGHPIPDGSNCECVGEGPE